MTADNSAGATLVNIFSVEPENQQALLAMLRENTETVIRTLKGWIDTTLVASDDGKQVVIFSHWETAHDVELDARGPAHARLFPRNPGARFAQFHHRLRCRHPSPLKA